MSTATIERAREPVSGKGVRKKWSIAEEEARTYRFGFVFDVVFLIGFLGVVVTNRLQPIATQTWLLFAAALALYALFYVIVGPTGSAVAQNLKRRR